MRFRLVGRTGVQRIARALRMGMGLEVDRAALLESLRAAVAACFNKAAALAGDVAPLQGELHECADAIRAAWAEERFRALVDIADPAAAVLARLEELGFLQDPAQVPDWALLRAPEDPEGDWSFFVTDRLVEFRWGPDAVLDGQGADIVLRTLPLGRLEDVRDALGEVSHARNIMGVVAVETDVLRARLLAGLPSEPHTGASLIADDTLAQQVASALNYPGVVAYAYPPHPENTPLTFDDVFHNYRAYFNQGITDIMATMSENIDRVVLRGAALECLEDKADELESQAMFFKASSKSLKRRQTDNVMADLESCVNCCSGCVGWCMSPRMPAVNWACVCKPVEMLCRLLCCPVKLLCRACHVLDPICSRFCNRWCQPVCESCCSRCCEPMCDKYCEPLLGPLFRCIGRGLEPCCHLLGKMLELLFFALRELLLFVVVTVRFVRDRVIDCFAVVALLVLFLPAMFMLLVLRPTKAEVESSAYTARQELMETESAAKTATRRSHLVFRTLPMTLLNIVAPVVIVGWVMPDLDEVAAVALLGLQLGLMVVIQSLGTVRAAASWLEHFRSSPRRSSSSSSPGAEAKPFSLSNPANLLALVTLGVDLFQMASFPLSTSSSSSSSSSTSSSSADGAEVEMPEWCSGLFSVAYIQVTELADEWTALDSVVVAVGAVWVLIMIFARQFVHDLVTYSLMGRQGFKNEARQFFFGSFVGSVMYAHGRPRNISNKVALSIKLLTHTGFMLVTSHLLQALACDYIGSSPVLMADPSVTCWQGQHQAVALAALVAFGYYLPLCVMIQPILSNRLEETPMAVKTVQVYSMATTLVKCALLIVSSLTTSVAARATSILVFSAVLAGLTFVWFVRLPASVVGSHQPISVASFNRVKVLTYGLCAWSAAVMLAATEEASIVTADDFQTWLLAGWVPLVLLVLGWQAAGDRLAVKRSTLKMLELEPVETEANVDVDLEGAGAGAGAAERSRTFVGCVDAHGVHRLVEQGEVHETGGDEFAVAKGMLPSGAVSFDAMRRVWDAKHPATSLGVPVQGALVRQLRVDGGRFVSSVPCVCEDTAEVPPQHLLFLVQPGDATTVAALQHWATNTCREEDSFGVIVAAGQSRLSVLLPMTSKPKLDRGRFADSLAGLLTKERPRFIIGELAPKIESLFPYRCGLGPSLPDNVHLVVLAPELSLGQFSGHARDHLRRRWPAARVTSVKNAMHFGAPPPGSHERIVQHLFVAEVLDDYLVQLGVELPSFDGVVRPGAEESWRPAVKFSLDAEDASGALADLQDDAELIPLFLLHKMAAVFERWLAGKEAQRAAAEQVLADDAREWLQRLSAKDVRATVDHFGVAPTWAMRAMKLGDRVDVRDPANAFRWASGAVVKNTMGSVTVQLVGGRRLTVPRDEEHVDTSATRTADLTASMQPTAAGEDREQFRALAAEVEAKCPELGAQLSVVEYY